MALLLPRTFRTGYTQQRAARTQRRRRTPILTRLGRLTARALPTWASFRRAALSIGGLGGISYGAWEVVPALGYVVAGLSLLILEALTSGTGDP